MTGENQATVVRERPGCVIGIAFGIMVLGSMMALLWLPRTEKRDGAKLLESWLGLHQLPAGFEIRAATKFMGGEEVVQLANTSAQPEIPAAGVKPSKGASEVEHVDWARVKLGTADQRPLSLMFVRYPEDHAASELHRLFSEKLVAGKLEDVGTQGGRILLECGLLPLGDPNPAYVLERQFESGGTFKDIARVNLSSVASGLILHAEWSRSEPFSKSRLHSLLETFRRP